ncbi:hypothetical protein [Bradyrhizobium sp.]|uniref:hypothetical protein n=1 Tax=Bradyrhizobium sp. TaxID=376 RepID=UPI001DEDB599|nr:hypothetical protein [Bradyrhizobium sp.]MBV8697814.1 hypothetical protein [Bradyrhizobium sp.]MBV8919829.1 hypothetical protein [Bradyrhizobium sp.]MBV9985982.1 hypothetical protein [Bradyrhizobium sp.]
MVRWFFRVTGAGSTPATVPPHQSPSVAIDRPKELARAAVPKTVDRDQAKIRELLRLEFECAADFSLSRGNVTAAKILRQLAKTTRDVEVSVLHAYAQLLDDISDPAPSSDELRQIGVDWFPRNAAEYVERLASAREDARASTRNGD